MLFALLCFIDKVVQSIDDLIKGFSYSFPFAESTCFTFFRRLPVKFEAICFLECYQTALRIGLHALVEKLVSFLFHVVLETVVSGINPQLWPEPKSHKCVLVDINNT